MPSIFRHSEIELNQLERAINRDGSVTVTLSRRDGEKFIAMMEDRMTIYSGEGYDGPLTLVFAKVITDAIKGIFRYRLEELLAFWDKGKVVTLRKQEDGSYHFEFRVKNER